MATSSTQDVFCSSQDVWQGKEHPFFTYHGRNPQHEVQERAAASRSSNVWWNSASSQMPRSFPIQIQIYSGRAATSSEFNALVDYPAHVG